MTQSLTLLNITQHALVELNYLPNAKYPFG
jgi:hypothetical protein